MKRRDLIKKLEAAGYKVDRDDGNHTIYEKDGCRPVQVPRHRELMSLPLRRFLRWQELNKAPARLAGLYIRR